MVPRKRPTVLAFLVLVSVIGVADLWLHMQQRQYALNRQLIDALVHFDDKRALPLVNEGADPNTRCDPAPTPTLKQLWNQLMHRSTSAVNDSPTALLMACGDWGYDRPGLYGGQYNRLDHPQLVQAMLRHGADANIADSRGDTPLLWAIRYFHQDTFRLLLDYKANVNVRSRRNGWMALHAAVLHDDREMVRLLLEHGANVNAQDNDGATPILSTLDPVIIRQLLAHGADPYLPDKAGATLLKFAQSTHRSDLVALLRQARANYLKK